MRGQAPRKGEGPVSETLLTPDAVADRLAVSPQWVWKAIRCGDMPARRIGKLYRVVPSEFEGWLAGRSTSATVPADARTDR